MGRPGLNVGLLTRMRLAGVASHGGLGSWVARRAIANEEEQRKYQAMAREGRLLPTPQGATVVGKGEAYNAIHKMRQGGKGTTGGEGKGRCKGV